MDSAAADWAGSGLAYLTGPADGPPDFSRAGVLAKARHVTAEIARLLGVDTDAATILAGRAALLGLTRQGRVSAGGPRGSCPAPTAGARSRCRAPTTRPRCRAAASRRRPRRPVADAGGMGRNTFQRRRGRPHPTARHRRRGTRRNGRSTAGGATRRKPNRAARIWRPVGGGPVVAVGGPLCAQLLARAGAVVVKVESPARPDGTRRGEPAFFDWMNFGKLSYAVDFDKEPDVLRQLLSAADVVIEGSRPPRCGAGN
ncbi:hypothetical protein I553_1253 [Mycobacterium xenopi 4042]|uniref:CoA-transferase III family protein n=1 Tax=Mycobacterium xenopi 4042 TaxID=1299334 RepID=X7ZC55_MYCXE|nr:hypothetical protein I553_1253 [Mycobacterium xenopi 4042]